MDIHLTQKVNDTVLKMTVDGSSSTNLSLRQPSPDESLAEDCLSGPEDVDPDMLEERFRVDRKKLEFMLLGEPDEDGNLPEESAEEFFKKIMENTGTVIRWPSKLKVGAKSRKDPHIRVLCKDEQQIKDAKQQVLSVLDTKTNRVTLKMDVSFTDHSHVIGKGGNNIKSVMHDTGCHIHFPDSNRGSQAEKSNQVSIAGQPAGVEKARSKIRELLPLVFTFELAASITTVQTLITEPGGFVQQLQQSHNVVVSVRQRPRTLAAAVAVRGSVAQAPMVKEATVRLMEHLAGPMGPNIPVALQMEIAPQHHQFILGRGGVNVKQVMARTGAVVHFPEPGSQRKGTVYITGAVESVYRARQQLVGCLPLVLMFDIKETHDPDAAVLQNLMETLDVFISVKPKPKQTSKSVIVKSIERNASSMYEARRSIMSLEKNTSNCPDVRMDADMAGLSATPPAAAASQLGVMGLMGQGLVPMNQGVVLLGRTQGQVPSVPTAVPMVQHSPVMLLRHPINSIQNQPINNLHVSTAANQLPQSVGQLSSANMSPQHFSNRPSQAPLTQQTLQGSPLGSQVSLGSQVPHSSQTLQGSPLGPQVSLGSQVPHSSQTLQGSSLASQVSLGSQVPHGSQTLQASHISHGSPVSHVINHHQQFTELHNINNRSEHQDSSLMDRGQTSIAPTLVEQRLNITTVQLHPADRQLSGLDRQLQQADRQLSGIDRQINVTDRQTVDRGQTDRIQLQSVDRQPLRQQLDQRLLRHADLQTLEITETQKAAEEYEIHQRQQAASEQQQLQQAATEQQRLQQAEQQRLQQAAAEQQRLQQAATEQQRLQQAATEQQRLQQAATEQQRLQQAATEQQRLQQAATEQQRLQQAATEQQRLQQAATEQQRLQQAATEQQRLQQAEQQRLQQMFISSQQPSSQQQQTSFPVSTHQLHDTVTSLGPRDIGITSNTQTTQHDASLQQLLMSLSSVQIQQNSPQSTEELISRLSDPSSPFLGSLPPLPEFPKLSQGLGGAARLPASGLPVSATSSPAGLLGELQASLSGSPFIRADSGLPNQQLPTNSTAPLTGVEKESPLHSPRHAASPDLVASSYQGPRDMRPVEHDLVPTGVEVVERAPGSPVKRSPASSGSGSELRARLRGRHVNGFGQGSLVGQQLQQALQQLPAQQQTTSASTAGNLTNGEAGSENTSPDAGTSQTFSPQPLDYDYKKLLATKAIKQMPSGSDRIPTDFWAGDGFSSSMPDFIIRDRLKRNATFLPQPSALGPTSPLQEEEEEEEECDPWKQQDETLPPLPPLGRPIPAAVRKLPMSLSSSNHMEAATLPGNSWSAKAELAELFAKLGLSKYTDLFRQQEIDVATFITLTDQDLRELGITTFGARRKMCLAIADMNKRRGSSHFTSLGLHKPPSPPAQSPPSLQSLPSPPPPVESDVLRSLNSLAASGAHTGSVSNLSFDRAPGGSSVTSSRRAFSQSGRW